MKLTEIKQKTFKPFVAHKSSGMTLIEIVFVVSILAGLMAYLLSNFSAAANSAKVDETKIVMGMIKQKLLVFKVHHNRYPLTSEGLSALVTNPGSSKKWRGPYMNKSKLVDPWHNEFEYESDGKKFKIISLGIEKDKDDDDIIFPEEDEGE